MIYKFKFEVYDDDNNYVSSVGEESGNFWWAFAYFMKYMMNYATLNEIGRNAT